MTKLDFKKTEKSLYSGKAGRWDQIDVPMMQFLAIEGRGDPNGPDYAAALTALYPLAYAIKFAAKSEGQDYVVPPLEALWWADALDAFTANRRDEWQWCAMLRVPSFVTAKTVEECRKSTDAKLKKKGTETALIAQVNLISKEEGTCLQTLHLGPYTDEGPTLAELHDHIMPTQGLTFNGPHHEIYLSDPRRVAPEKLRTILRQPVKRTG